MTTKVKITLDGEDKIASLCDAHLAKMPDAEVVGEGCDCEICASAKLLRWAYYARYVERSEGGGQVGGEEVNANYQKDSDEIRAWIEEGKKEGWVEDGVATGPTGHLYVAAMNLHDYCDAETTTDEEAELAMTLAKRIKNELT